MKHAPCRIHGGLPLKATEYDKVIVKLFGKVYRENLDRIEFTKEQLVDVCAEVGIPIKNVPDILYTYRSRRSLPDAIAETGNWIFQGLGKGKYAFLKLKRSPHIDIPKDLEVIRIPDSTPEIVLKHCGADEQSVLTKVRYNRLVDTFLSLTAYHLQGHFRTFLNGIGQVEIDELYVALDTDGHQYVIPVEAKGPDPREKLGVAQIGWLIAFANERYPKLTAKPVAVKSWEDGSIFLLEFNTATDLDEIRTVSYRRYSLVHEEGRAAAQTRLAV
jgi:hypothetical protein